MSEKKILSTVTKTLIKNVIRHTDSHNKVVEETDMWRQREKEIKRHDSQGSNYSFLKDRGVDMRYEFPVSRERRAHMDEEPRSTYWMKELYKAEEADNNRWGHSGYKELYPEHFSRSNSSSSDERERDRKHRDRQEKSKKMKRKKSRKRKHSESDTDSDSDIEKEKDKEKERKKRKKKHKSKEKKKKKKQKKKRYKSDSDS